MKSLVELHVALLLDGGGKCGAATSRDVKTLRGRVEREGDSFLTITLPAFCKDFERSLDQKKVAPGSFLSFKKEASGIPSFLKGFLRLVFDSQGLLLDKPNVDCIRAVRQICLFSKKVLRPCSPERMEAATERFAQCDNEIIDPVGQVRRYFKRVSTILWSTLLEGEDFRSHLTPRHGPGATQERISGNQKWVFRRWHRRLTGVGFTYSKFGRGSFTGVLQCKHHVPDTSEVWPDLVEPENEEPVRVVFVPKTLKTPRVIAVEPVVMQFAQQALSRWLIGRLESCPLTAGHVNFRDQTVNQHLALDSSSTGHLATVDLSEASDRVSLALVSDMLDSVPVFRDWVLACRSLRAQTPTGEVIRLKKFASMGSALCFPVESMVFFTIIIASRILRSGRFPTRRLVQSMARDVYVFGDDLLFPSDEAPAICDDLEALGLKVNRHKSFWTGQFRESCGADAFAGELVTPVYLRQDLPADRTDASQILSCTATANQLSQAGYASASALIRKSVERRLGPLPQVPSISVKGSRVLESAAIGWTNDSIVVPRRRWNKALQRSIPLLGSHVTEVRGPLRWGPGTSKVLGTDRV